MEQRKGETYDGQELLLTIHDDGEFEVAMRRFPWETWSPPIALTPVPVESVTA